MSARKRKPSSSASKRRRREASRRGSTGGGLPLHLREYTALPHVGPPRTYAPSTPTGRLRWSLGEYVQWYDPSPPSRVPPLWFDALPKSRRQLDVEAEERTPGVVELRAAGFEVAAQLLCGSLPVLGGTVVSGRDRESAGVAADLLEEVSTRVACDVDELYEQIAWLREIAEGPIARFLDAEALNEARRDALRRKRGAGEPNEIDGEYSIVPLEDPGGWRVTAMDGRSIFVVSPTSIGALEQARRIFLGGNVRVLSMCRGCLREAGTCDCAPGVLSPGVEMR